MTRDEFAKTDRIRLGRNYIRVGDTVKVKSSPGKRDGFEASVIDLRLLVGADPDQPVSNPRDAQVCVYGGRGGNACQRWFFMDRIERKAQTKQGEAVR